MKPRGNTASELLDVFFEKRANPPQQWIHASHDRLLDEFRHGSLASVDETFIEAGVPQRNPHRWTLVFASAAAVLVAALIFSRMEPKAPATASTDERVLVLKDKSRVELQPMSEVSLEDEKDGVRIRLIKGEVTVHAVKQHDRPFYVETKDLTVSVVGTVFRVSVEKEGSHVAVVEGRVIVKYGEHGATTRSLVTGEEMSTYPGIPVLELSAEQQKPVAFEVATIKPTPSDARDNGSMTTFPPGRFRQTNTTLRDLVRLAYGVQDYQISGGPAWSRDDRYDVDAKAETNVPRDQILLMIRALLAERFKLRIRETSETASVYNLVISKNGLKIQPVPESQSPNARINKYEGKRTMPRFAEYLAEIVGQPVIDQTKLTEPYDIKLEFTPDWVRERFPGRSGTIQLNGESLDLNGPSIFTALETQLGLRLEAAKGSVRFLVIESAEKPSGN